MGRHDVDLVRNFVERVYVLESVYDQFVAAAVRAVENLKMGAGDGNHYGSLIDGSQVAVAERHVEAQIAGRLDRLLDRLTHQKDL